MSEQRFHQLKSDGDGVYDRLLSQHEDLERRMAALERWQSFTLGVCAAVGALVGVGLTIASMVMR